MRAAGGRVLPQRGVVAAAVASLLLGGAAGAPPFTSAQTARGASPRIGRIGRLFNDGCGCTLQLPALRRRDDADAPAVFESDLGDRAQMNIDGRDVMLRLVRRRERVGGAEPRVGERSFEEYEGGGARVKMNFTTTKVCPPGDESCEVLSYSAVIAVTKGGRTRTVKASGQCGC